MNEEKICNTTLGLGTGSWIKSEKQSNSYKRGFWLDLSLPLHPNTDEEKDDHDSFSSKTIDDGEEERVIHNRISNMFNNDRSRKKLKLTTDQITLLEDSFKARSTLNTGQKQELAKKLNLLPRQIEVWFQNRRARTKLKQIEQECEMLKKCCETLTDENRRLKKELQKVRCLSLKSDHHQPATQPSLPFYIRYPIKEDKKTGMDQMYDDGN